MSDKAVEYDVKRFYVADATVNDLKAHAEDTAKLAVSGYRLFSIVPLVSSKPGLISFVEVWTKG